MVRVCNQMAYFQTQADSRSLGSKPAAVRGRPGDIKYRISAVRWEAGRPLINEFGPYHSGGSLPKIPVWWKYQFRIQEVLILGLTFQGSWGNLKISIYPKVSSGFSRKVGLSPQP